MIWRGGQGLDMFCGKFNRIFYQCGYEAEGDYGDYKILGSNDNKYEAGIYWVGKIAGEQVGEGRVKYS